MVGGGPSGLSAAISAARAGADVILCERYGCFGGVITTVGMETIAWYRYEGCTNDTEVSKQITAFETLFRRVRVLCPTVSLSPYLSYITVSNLSFDILDVSIKKLG